MFARRIPIALAATGLMVGATFAQSTWVEIDDRVQVPAFSATADQVDDWDVYDAAGTEIGEVEEVVGPDASTPTALVVDFEGNGGYADQDVVIPIDQFSLENNRLVLNADPAAVSGMEVWDD